MVGDTKIILEDVEWTNLILWHFNDDLNRNVIVVESSYYFIFAQSVRNKEWYPKNWVNLRLIEVNFINIFHYSIHNISICFRVKWGYESFVTKDFLVFLVVFQSFIFFIWKMWKNLIYTIKYHSINPNSHVINSVLIHI